MMMMAANIFAGISALAASPLAHRIGAINTMVSDHAHAHARSIVRETVRCMTFAEFAHSCCRLSLCVHSQLLTHLPSNILLLVVPFMPDARAAVTVLLLRFAISQMDVPARRSYVAAAVPVDERSAAAAITVVARGIGVSLSPLLCGFFLGHPDQHILFAMPFVLGGGLKIVYDALLFVGYRSAKQSAAAAGSAAPSEAAQYAQVGISPEDTLEVHDTDLYDEDAFEPMRK